MDYILCCQNSRLRQDQGRQTLLTSMMLGALTWSSCVEFYLGKKKNVFSNVLTLCSKMTNECHGHSCASSCFPYIFLFFPLFSSSVSVCVRVVGIASFLTPSSAPLHTCLQSADYRSRSAHLAVISVSHCSISNCSSVHIQSQNIASATAVVTCFRPLYRSVIISSC